MLERTALLVRRPAPERPLDAGDAELRRWMSQLGAGAVPQAVSLHLALHPGQDPGPVRDRFDRILSSRPPLSARELALGGNAIMKALGVGPSPLVGAATRHLLEKVIEDPSANTPERLAELLASFSSSRGS